MSNLARVYRPKKLSQIVGQPHLQDRVAALWRSGSLPSAFLCSGPSGHGKTTMARVIGRLVNCQNPKKAEACGECPSCQAMDLGHHKDYKEYDAASERGIDFVRNLAQNARYTPNYNYRISVLDEVHGMTRPAMEALLKLLEEGGSKGSKPTTIFILCTTDPGALPTTVLQRCTQLHFRHITPEDISNDLLRPVARAEKWKVGKAVRLEIAQAAEATPRLALGLLESVVLTAKERGASLKVSAGEAEGLVAETLKALGYVPPQSTALQIVQACFVGDVHKAAGLIQAAPRADKVVAALYNAMYLGAANVVAGKTHPRAMGFDKLPLDTLTGLMLEAQNLLGAVDRSPFGQEVQAGLQRFTVLLAQARPARASKKKRKG